MPPGLILADVSTVLSGVKDLKNWKMPIDNVKSTQNWSVPWSNSDDEALLIGIWKHGFGSWEEIQSDDPLGLKGKFFLDATKGKEKQDTPTPTAENAIDKAKKPKKASTPGAVHLVRRGDYLLLTLRESESGAKVQKEVQAKGAGPAEQAAARPKKPKAPSLAKAPSSTSASISAPLTKKKAGSPPLSARDSGIKPKSEQGNGSKQSKPKAKPPASAAPKTDTKPNAKAPAESDEEEDSEAEEEAVDFIACKNLLRLVKRDLKDLKASAALPREQKLPILSRCLTAIGAHIDKMAAEAPGGQQAQDTRRQHLWIVTRAFWPMEGVKWRAIKGMCKSHGSLKDKLQKADAGLSQTRR